MESNNIETINHIADLAVPVAEALQQQANPYLAVMITQEGVHVVSTAAFRPVEPEAL